MKYNVFIDGAEGTTGLKIHQYFQKREEMCIRYRALRLVNNTLCYRSYCSQLVNIFYVVCVDTAAVTLALVDVYKRQVLGEDLQFASVLSCDLDSVFVRFSTSVCEEYFTAFEASSFNNSFSSISSAVHSESRSHERDLLSLFYDLSLIHIFQNTRNFISKIDLYLREMYCIFVMDFTVIIIMYKRREIN